MQITARKRLTTERNLQRLVRGKEDFVAERENWRRNAPHEERVVFKIPSAQRVFSLGKWISMLKVEIHVWLPNFWRITSFGTFLVDLNPLQLRAKHEISGLVINVVHCLILWHYRSSECLANTVQEDTLCKATLWMVVRLTRRVRAVEQLLQVYMTWLK